MLNDKHIREIDQKHGTTPKTKSEETQHNNRIIDTIHKVPAFQNILNLTNFQLFKQSLIFKCKF